MPQPKPTDNAHQRLLSSKVINTSKSPFAMHTPVPVAAVKLEGDFWLPRLRINREVTLPSQYEHCENTGRIDNFRRASSKKDAPFQGIYYNDSDVYKWVEAVSWELARKPDPKLELMLDTVINEIDDAQQPDGYLNTYFTFELEAERWTNLKDKHELYLAGHLIQAAIAHRRATGGKKLLDVARRFADHICDHFGSLADGKTPGTSGHEEIEMALVELARETGEQKYLKQADYFLNARGQGLVGGDAYHQDHLPFRQLDSMVGHAVRAVYLTAGATDIYSETGEGALKETLERLWTNMTTRRMYINGGIGSRYAGEAFGKNFELPSDRAYAESCAAIGSVMWNWRLLMLSGEARYADLIETTLYNAVLPGLSLDGQNYFYQNPLADDGAHRRQPWFGCACCPPNLARMLASLPGYFYSASGNEIYAHLYASSTADIPLNHGSINIQQRTNYPWDGQISFNIGTNGPFALNLRIPAWVRGGTSLAINGKLTRADLQPGSYVRLERNWQAGDEVDLHLPMLVRQLVAHPHLAEASGKTALMRGPLLYCLEQADNPTVHPKDVVLPGNVSFSVQHEPELLGGVTTLTAQAKHEPPTIDWQEQLYVERSEIPVPSSQQVAVKAIPYYAWANRQPGAMRVWLRRGL